MTYDYLPKPNVSSIKSPLTAYIPEPFPTGEPVSVNDYVIKPKVATEPALKRFQDTPRKVRERMERIRAAEKVNTPLAQTPEVAKEALKAGTSKPSVFSKLVKPRIGTALAIGGLSEYLEPNVPENLRDNTDRVYDTASTGALIGGSVLPGYGKALMAAPLISALAKRVGYNQGGYAGSYERDQETKAALAKAQARADLVRQQNKESILPWEESTPRVGVSSKKALGILEDGKNTGTVPVVNPMETFFKEDVIPVQKYNPEYEQAVQDTYNTAQQNVLALANPAAERIQNLVNQYGRYKPGHGFGALMAAQEALAGINSGTSKLADIDMEKARTVGALGVPYMNSMQEARKSAMEIPNLFAKEGTPSVKAQRQAHKASALSSYYNAVSDAQKMEIMDKAMKGDENAMKLLHGTKESVEPERKEFNTLIADLAKKAAENPRILNNLDERMILTMKQMGYIPMDWTKAAALPAT